MPENNDKNGIRFELSGLIKIADECARINEGYTHAIQNHREDITDIYTVQQIISSAKILEACSRKIIESLQTLTRAGITDIINLDVDIVETFNKNALTNHTRFNISDAVLGTTFELERQLKAQGQGQNPKQDVIQ